MDYDNIVYCILLCTACSFWDFVMGLLKVASIADDQSERLEMEQGRDGQNV